MKSILIVLAISYYWQRSSNDQDKHRKLYQIQKYSGTQIALSSEYLWMLHGFSLHVLAACLKSKTMNWFKLRGQALGQARGPSTRLQGPPHAPVICRRRCSVNHGPSSAKDHNRIRAPSQAQAKLKGGAAGQAPPKPKDPGRRHHAGCRSNRWTKRQSSSDPNRGALLVPDILLI